MRRWGLIAALWLASTAGAWAACPAVPNDCSNIAVKNLSVGTNATIGGTLGVTGAATVSGSLNAQGTSNLGNASTNFVQITGAAANPTITVSGGGTNGSLILQAQGHGAINIRNLTGGIITQFTDSSAGTIGNRLQIAAQLTGTGVVINTNDATAGINFTTVPINFGRSIVMSAPIANVKNQALGGNWNISGSTAETGSLAANTFQVNDSLQIPTGSGAYTDWQWAHTTTASAVGNRTVVSTAIAQGAAPTSLGPGANLNFVASQTASTGRYNNGGTAGRANSTGGIWGAVFGRTLQTGATFWSGATVLELDVLNETGTSVRNSSAITIAVYSTHAVRGDDLDAAINIGGGGGTTLRDGVNFGSNGSGNAAFGTDSRLLYMEPGFNDSGVVHVGWMADMLYPTFDAGFVRSRGFIVDGTGLTMIGAGVISPVTDGMTLDVGYQGTGNPAVTTGGTSYSTGDVVRDAYNGLYSVTAAAGVVTALTTVVEPVTAGTPPVGAIALSNVTRRSTFGSGLTATPTWATRTTINVGTSVATVINVGNATATVSVTGATTNVTGAALNLGTATATAVALGNTSATLAATGTTSSFTGTTVNIGASATTLNLGTSATTLNIGTTAAGAINVGNATVNIQLGTGSALATNATAGFPLIPSMAGTPTGNVGALGKVALVYDSTNKKICVIIGATVECSGAFSP